MPRKKTKKVARKKTSRKTSTRKDSSKKSSKRTARAKEGCNDSVENGFSINPGAFEIPGNFVDENCNGDLGDCSPCGPSPGVDWKNHGQYVRWVAHAVEELVTGGFLTQDEGDALVSSSAQTDIGKKGFVPSECP